MILIINTYLINNFNILLNNIMYYVRCTIVIHDLHKEFVYCIKSRIKFVYFEKWVSDM